jgi:hypothetical protein
VARRATGAAVRRERCSAPTIPAGEILAARGWSLSDLSYGLGSSVPEPDVLAISLGEPVPRRYDPYVEIDHNWGWYAEAAWSAPRLGRVSLLRYDNNGDPTTSTRYEELHRDIHLAHGLSGASRPRRASTTCACACRP